ncbi:DUF998 domain-containing protein [uncultured Sulfitobacter sp.]|uniref:DUF998 domain-containing protein n=1 Tax=uncultured Sulfitobacter sp. TaxID=191468 RepID=UPI00260B0EE3|nr:DUF998 domain-containing protein [uncultured Sulfitobacter sp.]
MIDKNRMPESQRRLSPSFLVLLAWLAFVGGLALIVGNVVGSVIVPDHDWVSDTVSDLAAGRYEIIQDVALYGFAGTLTALALASAHLHGGGWQWSSLTVALMLLAVCVVIIGARNEYGDGDNEGIVIHIYIVYAMGALFVAAFVLAARLFADTARLFAKISWCCAGVWTLGAPVFFVMSTEYDGAWERGLGIISIVWTSAFAKELLSISARK